MSICADSALTYLSGLGYNVVRLPSTKFRPLGLLGTDGTKGALDWLGSLPDACHYTNPPPKPRRESAASLKGTRTSAIKFGVGLKILHGLFDAFDIDGAALRAGYAGGRFLRFSFDDPYQVHVDPVAVGKWLYFARPDEANPIVARYFSTRGPRAFVTTEVLTSRSITVSTLDEAERDAAVDVAKIKDAVGGKLDVKQSGRARGEIRYAGSEELTFGFKAYALQRSFDRWVIQGVRPGETFLGEEDEKSTQPHVFGNGWIKLTEGRHVRQDGAHASRRTSSGRRA